MGIKSKNLLIFAQIFWKYLNEIILMVILNGKDKEYSRIGKTEHHKIEKI
jgi:hypothetical protein